MSTISASTTTTTGYVVTSDSTGTLVFQTGATPTTALTINSSQTASFAGDVSATGTNGFLSTAGGKSTYFYADATGGNITVPGSNAFRIYTASAERMRITSAGNVGIGTDSPSRKLVVSNAGAQGFEFGAGVGASSGNEWLNYNRSTAAYIPTEYYASTHTFWSGTAGGTRAVTIDSSGNVGINTSSPGAKLDIAVAGEAIRLSGSASTAYIRSYSGGAGHWYMGSGGSTGLQIYTYTATPITFTVGGGTEAARFDTGSSFLVGTQTNVSPVGRLTTVQAGTGNAGAAISADATDANYTYNIAYLNAGRAATSAFNFIKCTSGNYGVTQFQVSGNGVVYAQNTTIQSLSDARVKENVRDSDEGLQVILGVKTRRFDFKDGFGNDRKNVLGFIAQEMEEVFPDAVSELPFDPDGEGPENPYKSVGPAALIPVLVKAIQELNAKVDAQAAEIATLKGAA